MASVSFQHMPPHGGTLGLGPHGARGTIGVRGVSGVRGVATLDVVPAVGGVEASSVFCVVDVCILSIFKPSRLEFSNFNSSKLSKLAARDMLKSTKSFVWETPNTGVSFGAAMSASPA